MGAGVEVKKFEPLIDGDERGSEKGTGDDLNIGTFESRAICVNLRLTIIIGRQNLNEADRNRTDVHRNIIGSHFLHRNDAAHHNFHTDKFCVAVKTCG